MGKLEGDGNEGKTDPLSANCAKCHFMFKIEANTNSGLTWARHGYCCPFKIDEVSRKHCQSGVKGVPTDDRWHLKFPITTATASKLVLWYVTVVWWLMGSEYTLTFVLTTPGCLYFPYLLKSIWKNSYPYIKKSFGGGSIKNKLDDFFILRFLYLNCLDVSFTFKLLKN